MNRIRLIIVAVGAIAATAAAIVAPAAAIPGSTHLRHACAAPHFKRAMCLALYRAADKGQRADPQASKPTGLTPAQIAAAYKLPISKGSGQTIAIVDAYDNPKTASDLATYRKQFDLPACTVANKCFRKVNQRGATKPLPQGDPDWGVEIALDLQAVSAACPNCHILLVEADSDYLDDLGAAENTAVRLHAAVVSNSFGGNEYNGAIAEWKKYYNHPGVAIVAASGDSGFQPAFVPASFPSTIAVGGTTLTKQAGTKRGWTETVWGNEDGGAGSGCSAYFGKPKWQHDPNCLMRTASDVSAVADPITGLSIYDTYGLGADNGWLTVGGTSLSAPLVSGMIGLAGNAAKLSNASYIYAHRSAVYDVVGGSNAIYMDCGGDYLCTGLPGYDAPSGVGTPHGVGAL